MGKPTVTRKELLERWSVIEQEDDDDGLSSTHPVKRRRLRQLKEQWFLDAFNFLIYLPGEDHVWCGYWDLMGPLLETFYNYFKEEAIDSPLKLLWNRISKEMRSCTLCIHQHHQAQEMYSTEYEQSCISPLLDVLHTLDEERISQHLKDLNARIARGEYDMAQDSGEVVSVMFEVLMFPILLDDLSLSEEFQTFIEAVDSTHELKLDGHQQYPGVYALLFVKSRRVRSIGLRLAGHAGKLRRSTELDPLQFLLKQCIFILETEGVPSVSQTLRPRVQLDRPAIWLGMKALIGFLEPPAFEEGILDRYPIFLSIVLNHISDDSAEFSHAVNCLRLLFEKLGCKLWLRATLSPSVMRNTLLGQCFHTRNEKSHKEIFDLFQPFLQSLEALQDGEHEKQRRHFLYFLLHQVPVSSNFSILMRKKACQIALLIVLRGYRMDPPSPPAECAHMWGPSLVSSLKDSSLHTSLRQPAIDLIQTIIVSDASALISMICSGQLHPSDKPIRNTNYGDAEEEEEILADLNIKEDNNSCWKEFTVQHKTISQVDGSWMCVPMLWFDVLVETDPFVLPLSFSKAVFWALSRFSVVEPEKSTEMTLSVKNWFAACATEISYLLVWKVPTGSDDGGDGSESRNSIRISTMCLPLVKTFKRLTAHYTSRMGQGEFLKQWTWEPMMGNSLILLLVDPNDNTRQVARIILEQVSNVRGLTGCLQFLCYTSTSLLAILLGLRHALKLVQLDSVLSNFQTLHHLFFVLLKLLKEGNSSAHSMDQNMSDASDVSKISGQGGFLKQPVFNSPSAYGDQHSSAVNSILWKKFSCILSKVAWPSIMKCLDGGKTFTDYTISQMTCIRLLEVMPIVFERLPENFVTSSDFFCNLKWLHDLADWGKSSLAAVVRYWKLTFTYLLCQIKESYPNKSIPAISDIEKLISCEKVSMDEVSKQVARLSLSLMDKSPMLKKTILMSSCSPSGESPSGKSYPVEIDNLIVEKPKLNIIHSESVTDLEGGNVIVLSDDEEEPDNFSSMSRSTVVGHLETSSSERRFKAEPMDNKDLSKHLMASHGAGPQLDSCSTDHIGEKLNSDTRGGIVTHQPVVQEEPLRSKIKEIESKDVKTEKSLPIKKVSDETSKSKLCNSLASQPSMINKTKSGAGAISASKVPQSKVTPVQNTDSDEVIKDIVHDTDDDAWNFSFFKPPKRQQLLITKPNFTGPKRQVIRLDLPVKNRFGNVKQDGVKRFQPPKLETWYRPILELDFFVAVGLAPGIDGDNQNIGKLQEVPVYFQSPDAYLEIFRPLVLEEFKAQLQSSYQESTSSGEMCCGSLSVLSVERIDDFHMVRFVHDENESTGSKNLVENDLILISREPLQNSVSDVHTIGKVERREKDNKRRSNILAIRLYLLGSPRLNRVRKLLTDRSKWYVTRIMSITPQLREFQALSSIREIPLLPIILNPVDHHCGRYESRIENLNKLPQPLQKIFKSSYNGSQQEAIGVAIGPFDMKKDFELTLIQGPPGTGKTRTIVAIISGLLAFSQMKDTRRANGPPVCGNNSSSNQRISNSAAVARAWQDAAVARQLNEDMKDNGRFSSSCNKRRILICAQSNAAVDELVARISGEGLYGCNGETYNPYIVRVGNAKTVHANSLPFFIDTLVENRLEEEKRNILDEKKSDNNTDTLTMIRSNLEKLLDRIRHYEAKRASLEDENSNSKILVEGDSGETEELSEIELKDRLRRFYEKKKMLYADLSNVQAREKKANEEIRALRHKLRTTILKEAEIVVTTLSGCGGDVYGVCSGVSSGHKFMSSSENTLFDAVLIDEAAQALEPATLIPLQLLKSRGSKCIMVGDPKQLPATVLSNIASKYLFQCSMFERLQRAGHPIIMLTQQYRMHPEICRFPSAHFYDGKLLNGEKMSSKAAPFHESWCLRPYVFFDITDGQELRGKDSASLSLYNECEADAAVELLKFFRKSYPSEFFGGRIGIITPYKRQLSLLRSRISSALGSSISAEVEFNTVDGFQGREVDILLLSTVRASGSYSEMPKNRSNNLGFVADVRRMNVALTRAKLSLWIFGNVKTLQTNPSWAALVEDAKHRNLIVVGRKPYSLLYKRDLTNQGSRGDALNMQMEKVDKCAVAPKKIVNNTSERKRRCSDNVPDHVSAGNYSSPMDDASKKGTRVRDGTHFRRSMENASVVPSKSGKLKVEENQEKTNKRETCRSNEKQSKVVKAEVGKRNDNTERETRRESNTGTMKSRSQKQRDEVHLKPMKCDKRQEEKMGTSSSGRTFKDKHEQGSSHQVEIKNDSIIKRKQQREAVDALLSSALISSKKGNNSNRSSAGISSKRSLPTPDMNPNPVRSQKRRNG